MKPKQYEQQIVEYLVDDNNYLPGHAEVVVSIEDDIWDMIIAVYEKYKHYEANTEEQPECLDGMEHEYWLYKAGSEVAQICRWCKHMKTDTEEQPCPECVDDVLAVICYNCKHAGQYQAFCRIAGQNVSETWCCASYEPKCPTCGGEE